MDGLTDVDLSELDPAALRALVGVVRCGQRALEGLLVLAAEQAAVLAAERVGPGPDELLVGRGEVRAATARGDAQRAVTARRFPLARAALLAGEIGGEHLDALARVGRELSDRELEALCALEGEVVAQARRRTLESFTRWLRHCVNQIHADFADSDEDGDDGAAAEPEPTLRTWVDRHGRAHLSLETDLITHEELVGIIERHRTKLSAGGASGSAEPATQAVLAARALVDLLTGARSASNGGLLRAAITLVVDSETAINGPHSGTVCETGRGTPVPVATAVRFACSAVVRKVVLGPGGVPVDVGRARRTATPAQWASLTTMYSTCAWFGCDRPVSWCQAHHLQPWEFDGRTDLDNLVPLCSHHHHLVHEGGWKLKLGPDRALHHRTPDGAPWASAQPDRLERVAPGTSTNATAAA